MILYHPLRLALWHRGKKMTGKALTSPCLCSLSVFSHISRYQRDCFFCRILTFPREPNVLLQSIFSGYEQMENPKFSKNLYKEKGQKQWIASALLLPWPKLSSHLNCLLSLFSFLPFPSSPSQSRKSKPPTSYLVFSGTRIMEYAFPEPAHLQGAETTFQKNCGLDW